MLSLAYNGTSFYLNVSAQLQLLRIQRRPFENGNAQTLKRRRFPFGKRCQQVRRAWARSAPWHLVLPRWDYMSVITPGRMRACVFSDSPSHLK